MLNWRQNTLVLLAFWVFAGLGFSQTPTVGVLSIDQGAAADGFILLSGMDAKGVYLIDYCGREINAWESSLYTPGASVYLAPNGDLVRTCKLPNTNLNMGGIGGRIERWSWEDSLVWEYDFSTSQYSQHHDIELLPNGNILLLATERKTGLDPLLAGRDPALVSNGEVWSEFLVEIQPVGPDSGIVVWEWHIWDHLIQEFDSTRQNYGVVADHPELMDLNYIHARVEKDWLHANSVAYNPHLYQIMLSIAEINELWVIDHSTTTQEAAGHTGGLRGKGGDLLYRWGNPAVYQRGTSTDQQLFFQHDAHWIPDDRPDSGKVIIFNNGVGRGYSSVEMLTPPVSAPGDYLLNPGQAFGPATSPFTYTTDTLYDFFSKNTSGAEQLSNGNLLICEGAKGFNFEVDPLGAIVWRYMNPVIRTGILQQGDVVPTSANSMFRISRYDPDYPGFQGRDLTPGLTLEWGTDPASCLSVITDREQNVPPTTFLPFPNPVKDQFQVNFPGIQPVFCRIVNIFGQVKWSGEIHSGVPVNISGLESGIYWLISPSSPLSKIVKTEP